MTHFKCKYCESSSAIYKQVGPHVGEWCNSCTKWQRWVPKAEYLKTTNATETTITNKLIDAQLLKDEARHAYEENLNEELPWYD